MSVVEMIGTALVIWCVFWVPLIVIARNIVRQARPWDDFAERTPLRDRQHLDRMARGGKSFREALALSDNECAEYVAANNNKPVGQFVEWPEITEDRLKSIYHGEG